jgi:hypothetical protein
MNGSRYLTKLCPILIIGTLLLVPTSVSHAQADVPRFEPADCPIDVPHDPPIDCGHLVVPEDYDDQKRRTIRLPVMIIHSRSASPASDPLLFTAGGPGENALPFVWQFASSPYVESRDVIILQPRGGFNAEPSLNCGYAQLMGHFVSAYSPCAQGIIADFLNDPRSAPDTSCIAAMPGPEFVLPQDVLIAPGIYRVTFNVGQSGFEEILYMICLLIFVAEIGLLIVAAILLLVRRRERAVSTDRIARLAHPLAGLVAGLNLGLAVALAITLNRLVDTERLLLRFGVPSEYAVLFVIPAVTAILTVALVLFVVVIWVRSHWSLAQRVFFSVITLGAVIFTALMAHWDLMAWPL